LKGAIVSTDVKIGDTELVYSEQQLCAFVVRSQSCKQWILAATGEQERQRWIRSLRTRISSLVTLPPAEEKALCVLSERFPAANRRRLLVFLREHRFDVERTSAIVKYDQIWRQQIGVSHLQINHIYQHLKRNKVQQKTNNDYRCYFHY